MEVFHNAPDSATFVSLAEHQSHTPASFYNGPPVLHHRTNGCKIIVSAADLHASPALSALQSAPGANGVDSDADVEITGIDVWVTSERLLLYGLPSATGLAIPYPAISLHAIQRVPAPGNYEDTNTGTDVRNLQGLYMQLIAGTNGEDAANNEDEDMSMDPGESSLALTVVPGSAVTPDGRNGGGVSEVLRGSDESSPSGTETELLYAALSVCSDLHPDPTSDDENEEENINNGGSILYQCALAQRGSTTGELPPPMPGSSGWITAENVGDFFDEEGNWIGNGEAPGPGLGLGAGTVRAWEGDEEGKGIGIEEQEGNDEGEEGEEKDGAAADGTKWRRTS